MPARTRDAPMLGRPTRAAATQARETAAPATGGRGTGGLGATEAQEMLAAALAAGETPSPEMVAAAGPEGSIRPAVAWAYLMAAVVLILGTSTFLAPRATDWGLAFMSR